MGFFSKVSDFFSGVERPVEGTPVITKEEVKKKILAINDEKKPFKITESTDAAYDLLAEWRIVDAKWYEYFAKAGLKKSFQVWIKLDESTHIASSHDTEYTVEWKAGVPELSLVATAFRGQKTEISFGGAYGVKEDGSIGKIYEYSFSSSELKDPIKKAVLEGGWVYKKTL